MPLNQAKMRTLGSNGRASLLCRNHLNSRHQSACVSKQRWKLAKPIWIKKTKKTNKTELKQVYNLLRILASTSRCAINLNAISALEHLMKKWKMTTISHVNWQSLSHLIFKLTFDRSFAMAAMTLSLNLIHSQLLTKKESLKQGHSKRKFSIGNLACLLSRNANKLTLKPLSYHSQMPPWVPRLSANTNKSSIRWRMQSLLLAHSTKRLLRVNTAEVVHVIAIVRRIPSRNPRLIAYSSHHSTSAQKQEDVKRQRNNSMIRLMKKLSVHQYPSVPEKCRLISSLRQLRLLIRVHQKS